MQNNGDLGRKQFNIYHTCICSAKIVAVSASVFYIKEQPMKRFFPLLLFESSAGDETQMKTKLKAQV